jgi:hypothetical protein
MHVGARTRETLVLPSDSMLPAVAAPAHWLLTAIRSLRSERDLSRCEAMRRIG